jgi:hypothetical protein
MFVYPRGWFPWQVEWVLGFPRCPYGGVSIGVWSRSCGIAIALAGELVTNVFQQVQVKQPAKPTKIAMEAEAKSK